jgi:hypothetical protein
MGSMANLYIGQAQALSYFASVETTEQGPGKVPEENPIDTVAADLTAVLA